jgi:hypothetical protein
LLTPEWPIPVNAADSNLVLSSKLGAEILNRGPWGCALDLTLSPEEPPFPLCPTTTHYGGIVSQAFHGPAKFSFPRTIPQNKNIHSRMPTEYYICASSAPGCVVLADLPPEAVQPAPSTFSRPPTFCLKRITNSLIPRTVPRVPSISPFTRYRFGEVASQGSSSTSWLHLVLQLPLVVPGVSHLKASNGCPSKAEAHRKIPMRYFASILLGSLRSVCDDNICSNSVESLSKP